MKLKRHYSPSAVVRNALFGRERRFAPRGMTLAELVVVLMILAIVATVAVEAISPRVEQAQIESTERSLEQVRAAILSVDEHATAGAAVTGFVADNGRFPNSLAELTWTTSQLVGAQQLGQSTDLSSFAVQPAPAPHGDVLIPRGFRGPYLRLPVGHENLIDGWGMPFAYAANASTGGVTAVSPAATRPSGKPSTDFHVDVAASEVLAVMLAGKLYVTRNAPPTESLQLCLLGPGANGAANVASGVRFHLFAIAASAFVPIVNGNDGGGSTLYETNYQIVDGMTDSAGNVVRLWAGPAAIRAASGDASVKSAATHLVLKPGGTHLVDLRLALPDAPTTPPAPNP